MSANHSTGVPAVRPDGSERDWTTDSIRREVLALRARVRTLAEHRAATEADRFTQELLVLSEAVATAMAADCEDRAVLARVHYRLGRRINADVLRVHEDALAAVDARARGLVLARLDALLARVPPRSSISSDAPATLTLGGARALRTFERHRDLVRDRFRALNAKIQTELADLSLELAGETAARLCLCHGRDGQEWLWWRLSRVVNQFVVASKPKSLPAQLELLATRSILSGLEKYRLS